MLRRSVAALTVVIASAATVAGYSQASTDLLSSVDHLVYASPDLDRGVRDIESRLGVRATSGGSHPGLGTRNALLALGPTAYLEIFAPDPNQPPPPQPRGFGIDTLKGPRLAAWFVHRSNLEQLRSAAVSRGVPLGEIRSGARRTPDGIELSWQFTDPRKPVANGIVPFFIDWGTSPHPARSAAKGASLVSLRAEHPDLVAVRGMLRELQIDLPVTQAPVPVLIAVIDGPKGRIELRSDQ